MTLGSILHQLSRRQKLMAICFWLGLCLIWLSASFTPIYPDEIAYRLIGSRLLPDHGAIGNIFPTCPSSFSVAVPWSWMPAKTFESMVFGWFQNPIYIRFVSLSIAIAALCGAYSMLVKMGYAAKERRLFLFLLSMGTIPFSFILARPEATIFACLFWLVSLSIDPRRVMLGGVISGGLFFFLASTLLSAHPKTFLFLPALALLFLAWSRRANMHVAVRSGVAVSLVGLVVQTQRYWSVFSVCPENKGIQKMIDDISLSPHMLVSDPFGFVRSLALSFVDSISYFKQILFRHKYMSDWIPRPSLPLSPVIDGVLDLVIVLLLVACFVVAFQCLRDFFVRLILPLHMMVDVYYNPANYLCPVLVLALLLYMGVNKGKHFYEVAFVWPLLFTGVFAYKLFPHFLSRLYPSESGFVVLSGVALIMGMVVVANFMIPFLRGYEGIGVSLTTLSTQKNHAQITELSHQCGLPDRLEDATHLVVDDLTYQYFHNSQKPVIVTWLQVSTDGVDKPAFMRAFKTSGIIARCGYIPDEMKKTPYFHALTETPNPTLDICCVAPGHYDAP